MEWKGEGNAANKVQGITWCPGHLKGGSPWGLNLALCAVNMGEAAKESIPRWLLAEIYATSALQVKAALPDRLHFMAVRGFLALFQKKLE